MTLLVALSRITRKHPGAADAEVVGYDKNGNAVVKLKSETLLPGDLFEPADADQERELLRSDDENHGEFAAQFAAARLATENEIIIYQARGQ